MHKIEFLGLQPVEGVDKPSVWILGFNIQYAEMAILDGHSMRALQN